MQKAISKLLRNTRYAKLVNQKYDSIILSNVIFVPFNFIFIIIKFVIGVIFHSSWLLGFGIYYLVMVLAKLWISYRYTKLRLNTNSLSDRIKLEQNELFIGGLLLSLAGFSFAIFCFYMFQVGVIHHYNDNVTYIIALMGFIKLISSIIGLLKVKKYKIPIITLLKIFQVADGSVALVLTQYAILIMEKSPNASQSTGELGLVVGILILIIGFIFMAKNNHNKVQNR